MSIIKATPTFLVQGEPRLGCWGNQTRWKYFSPFRLRAGSLHARNQENCLLLLVFLSTVYSLFDDSRKNVSITTIKILCDGLDISLGEFFSSSEFDELEQEIE
jgi:hypothetical protein